MSQFTKIGEYMTSNPTVIDARATLEEAFSLMSDGGVRHLPVAHDRKLVGILSDRDIAKAWPKHKGGMPLVEEVMTRSPYTVTQDAPMIEVLQVMAENKLGCAVVKGPGDKIAGIFTTTDGLRLLTRFFTTRKKKAA